MTELVVYKTTNLINGKFYIGKDSKNKASYLGSGKYLKRAIDKYGKENFTKEILETCETLESLSEREIFWIKELDARNSSIAYNIHKGGKGGDADLFSESLKKMWEKLTPEERKIFRNKQLKNMWKFLTPEQRTERMKSVNAANTSEMRSEVGKKLASTWTPEEFSRRSKLGWSNLTPEQRSERAKLMKTPKISKENGEVRFE